MNRITDYLHKFNIDQYEIELLINYNNKKWTCEVVKGETGTGTCSGGECHSLSSFINEMEKQHRYSFNFFNYGYKIAKQNSNQ